MPNVILITSQSCSHGERILSQTMPPAALSRIAGEKSKQHPATCSLRCGALAGPGTLSRNSWLRLREAPTLCVWTRNTSVKNPSLSFPLHHLSEGRRCESIPPHLVPSNPSPPPPPSPPHCSQRGYRGAAHRSGAGGARRGAASDRGKEFTDEPEVGGSGSSPLSELLHSAPARTLQTCM